MNEPILPELQAWGDEREEILNKFKGQIAEWGLAMPDTEPLVMHFGLNDFWKMGEIEYWIVNEEKAGYCGKFIFAFDSQSGPYHHHKNKHETFFIVKGRLKMRVNDEDRVLNEGNVLILAPGTWHSWTGDGNAIFLEVSTPSVISDNFFADKRISYNVKDE